MWFKMGSDILNGIVIKELSECNTPRDSARNTRKMAFIYLLSETAENHYEWIQDASELARLVDTTLKQAQIVWDVCIKHGVLRKVENGYSAREWMIEVGILGDFTKRPCRGESGKQVFNPGQYHTKSKTEF